MDKKKELIKKASKLVDRAIEERRGMTQQEEKAYNVYMADIQPLVALEQLGRQREQLARLEAEMEKPWKPILENRQQFREYVIEQRALSAGVDTAGGYFLGGELVPIVVNAATKASAMARLCGVNFEYVPDDTPYPRLGDLDQASWTGEIVTLSDDTSTPAAATMLDQNPLTKLVKVSRKLMRSPLAVDAILTAIGEACGSAWEQGFLRGTGTGEPLGLTLDPKIGVTTASAGIYVTGDDVLDWIYSLGGRFQERAAILTTTDFVKKIHKLKDGEGNYIFKGGKLDDKPVYYTDGLPTCVSDGNFIASTVVAVIGDFRDNYRISADPETLAVQMLMELYAATNQVGFKAWQRVGGGCVNPSAFRLLKTAAA